MIKIALISVLTLGAIIQVNAQSRTYQATIAKNHHSNEIYIVSAAKDSVLVTDPHSGNFISDAGYQLKWGQGRKKDERKIQERDKRYLTSQGGDTLMTVYKGYELNFNDGSVLKKVRTKNGWQFRNSEKEVLANIDLLWNTTQWSVDIENKMQGTNADLLDHFIFANIARWLSVRDDGKRDDSDDDFYYTLWLTSLSNKP